MVQERIQLGTSIQSLPKVGSGKAGHPFLQHCFPVPPVGIQMPQVKLYQSTKLLYILLSISATLISSEVLPQR